MSFEANQGQTEPHIRFLSRGPGYRIFLAPAEAVLALGPERAAVRMTFVGASREAQMTGLDQLAHKSHYFIGRRQDRWRTDVPNYAKVRYAELYPGIDLLFHGTRGELEYDLIVAPGAEPQAIELRFTGVTGMTLSENGDLILNVPGGQLVQKKPLIFQDVEGLRTAVEGGYVIAGADRVRFSVADYDASEPLVIDPVLAYSTYLGGSGSEDANGIALDAAGNAYVTGGTDSVDFPTVNALQPTGAVTPGNGDVFLTKLNAAGNALVYSTYIGGSGNDGGVAIALDPAGNVYLTGRTLSNDFPLVNALQASGAGAAFVTKVNPSGSALVYSTYLGGGNDGGRGIAVDAAGNAHVTGFTSGFTTVNAIQPTYGGGASDAFVAKLDAAGSSLLFWTFLGGAGSGNLCHTGADGGSGIAVDSLGNIYVTGFTNSATFPVANAFRPTTACGNDAFVTKLNANGSAFVYSTYLGGSGEDGGSGIAVDAAGNAYVTGSTASADFPIMNAYQSDLAGGTDAYVTKLDPAGALAFSTYFGGGGNDAGAAIAVDVAGSVIVAGNTLSANLPILNAVQDTLAGAFDDAFVAKLARTGSSLRFSTYLGGGNLNRARSLAVDGAGNAYLAGLTSSTNFPTANAFQGFLQGSSDAFVAKIAGLAGARFDFGGDGRADVVWRNSSTGENYLYPMNGTSIGAGEGYLRTVADTNWKIAGVGDFDGDGKADIFWRNTSTGDNYIYLMNGTSIQNEGYVRTVADTNWEVVGVGDFNGDGKDDILWRNTSTGENYIYPMDGLAILPSEGYLRSVASHHWQVAGVGKFDAGPTADILWRNTRTGENYIYLMNGTAITGEGFIRTVAALEWQIAGVGDVTGDGKDDILWRNVATGETYVYPMSGTTIVAGEGYLRTVADLNWRIAGMGDYDGDGNADVLWRHAVTGENYLYPMDGLTIKPTEGYLRTVSDLSWKPRHSSPFAIRRGPVDGAQVPFVTAASGTTWARMDLFSREMSGIIQTTGLTGAFAAHIHLAPRGQDGGIIVNYVAQGPDDWVPAPGEPMPAANYVHFLTDGTYVNVHTPARSAGEIRGQLE